MSNADVFKAGVHAARLIREPGGVRFSYDPEYVAAGLPAVASRLPLTDTPVITQAGAVPPFFAGLLPEGRRLTNLRHNIKASADDELALLIAVGEDPIGDVQVVREGGIPSEPMSVVSVGKNFSDIRFGDVLANAGIVDPVGIAGVQDKVSVRMLSLPVRRAHERYILKLNPPEYPTIVENEGLFNSAARDARLRPVDARIVRDADQHAGLLVTRFDRIARPHGVGRLAVEDGCQVLGLWPADKYSVSLERCASALISRCDAQPVAAREIFRQTLFAWLTGNGDVHAKNLSVVQHPDGEWRIAPAYDLPSTVPYGDKTCALSMQGRRSGFSRRHFVDFGRTIGLPERAAIRELDGLLDRTETLHDTIHDNEVFVGETLDTLERELKFRRRQLTAPE